MCRCKRGCMVLYAFAILLNAQVVCGCPVTKHKMALSTFSFSVTSDEASTAISQLWSSSVSQLLAPPSFSSLFMLMSTLSILYKSLQEISALEAFISFLCRVWEFVGSCCCSCSCRARQVVSRGVQTDPDNGKAKQLIRAFSFYTSSGGNCLHTNPKCCNMNAVPLKKCSNCM